MTDVHPSEKIFEIVANGSDEGASARRSVITDVPSSLLLRISKTSTSPDIAISY
jgi:hypothetical protein